VTRTLPRLTWGQPPSAVLRSEAPLSKDLSSRPEQLLREAKHLRSGEFALSLPKGTRFCFWAAQRFSAAIQPTLRSGALAPEVTT